MKDGVNHEVEQPDVNGSSVWPPTPTGPVTKDLKNQKSKIISGSKWIDAVIGLAAGTIPLLILSFITLVLLFGDYSHVITGIEIKGFIVSAAIVQCLICFKWFGSFTVLFWSSLISSSLTGFYLAYVM